MGAPGRSYPQSIESERALLGGLILDSDAISMTAEIVKPEHFYRPDHQELFRLLVELDASNTVIDVVSLPERIKREGKEQIYGGALYVTELPDAVPSTANLEHYAKVIREKATLREMITRMEHMSTLAYNSPQDPTALIEQAAREMAQLGTEGSTRGWEPISSIVDDEVVRIEGLTGQPGGVTGVSTGFIELDDILAGLQRTDLVILAARPAMGKTALALNIAQNAALAGHGVGIYSLEMSRGQLVTRMMCSHALVEGGRVKTGNLKTSDWERLLESSNVLRTTKVFIDDTPGLSIGDVRSRARRLRSRCPELGLIVIDYLQLMRGDDPKESRTQQISAISRGLKGLAKDLDVPVVALSQLNRGVEQRQDKRPMVSDLRESGAIEQDADVIMFIYRDEYYNPDSPDQGLAEVIIAKQRNGSTGKVKLVFQGRFTRFDNHQVEDLQV